MRKYLHDALTENQRLRDGIKGALAESRTMQRHQRSSVTLVVLQEHLENVLDPDRAAREADLGFWPWAPRNEGDDHD